MSLVKKVSLKLLRVIQSFLSVQQTNEQTAYSARNESYTILVRRNRNK